MARETAVLATLFVLLSACERRASPDRRVTAAQSASVGAVEMPARRVRAIGQLGPGKGTLVVSLEPPANGTLTAGAPLSVEAHGGQLTSPARVRGRLGPGTLPLRIPIEVVDGATGPTRVQLSYYWCGLGEGAACRPERAELVVELDTSGDSAGGEAHLSYRALGS